MQRIRAPASPRRAAIEAFHQKRHVFWPVGRRSRARLRGFDDSANKNDNVERETIQVTNRLILFAAVLPPSPRAAAAFAQDAEPKRRSRNIGRCSRRTRGAIRVSSMSIAAKRCGRRRRGPKNVSLEQCDLGKGPGKVDGAFAELPRYFADADRVMDVETRILWCMEKLQGFNAADS